MIEPPKIAETETQAAAVIRSKIPREKIQAEIPPAIKELMDAIYDQGLNITGPLFTHHLTMSLDFFDFNIGFPVDVHVSPSGRVQAGELPAAKVIRTIYHGGYEGLFGAWEQFGKSVQGQFGSVLKRDGLEPDKTLWESYLIGPETESDPENWRTELNLPLRHAT